MPVETLSIQFTTTLWFDDVPGKFLDRVLVVARRLLLMSSSGIAACAFTGALARVANFLGGTTSGRHMLSAHLVHESQS